MLLLSSKLIGGSIDHTRDIKGATTLAESGILLSLPHGVYGLVADIRLFSLSQGYPFDFKDTYLAYHGSNKVNWDKENRVECFLYVRTNGVLLDIPAREVMSKNWRAINVQVKRGVGVVPIRINPVPGKTHEEVAHTVSSAHGSSADFSHPAVDKPVSKGDIFEESTS